MNILSPDCDNFRPYGKLINYPNSEAKGRIRNLWRIVHTVNEKVGWRVAYLVLRDKSIGRLEAHPDSDETFEPVKGRVIIFVSKSKSLRSIKCFYIDKPFVLRRGIWHGLIALDDEAEIKITENAKLKCLYWKFGFRIKNQAELVKRIKAV